MPNSSAEHHLMILWEHARPEQKRILDDLTRRMSVLGAFEFTWSPQRVAENFTRFYGQNLPPGSFKEDHCGRGAFLALILQDQQPLYELRETSKGPRRVNVNTFDAKQLYREWTGGGHRIHATDSESETRHDVALLFGMPLADLTQRLPRRWTGKITPLKVDLVGASGWKDLTQLFSVLNEAIPYVVMRNFEGFPHNYRSEAHGDIDLLTTSDIEMAYVVNARKVFAQAERVHYGAHVGGKEVRFDFRFTGDGYYDGRWQRDMLDRRVMHPGGFYVPSPTDHFHSLLYHALVHKPSIAADYASRLAQLASLEGVVDGTASPPSAQALRDPVAAKTLLDKYLSAQDYRYTRPADPSVHFNAKALGSDAPAAEAAGNVPHGLTDAPSSWMTHVLVTLRETRDHSLASAELRARIADPLLARHLGAARANLLRPLEARLAGQNVLELGAGFGTLTRYLGEIGARVTAVEAREEMALGTALRCADLSNVRVVQGSPSDYDDTHRYDWVLLADPVGLEAGASGRWAGGLSEALESARQWLRPGGRLLVLTANRLGLKHWAGAPQGGSPWDFAGVQGLDRSGEPCAPGREELAGALRQLGLQHQHFLYPYPDQGVPQIVISEAALGAPPAVLHNLLSSSFAPNDGVGYPRLFSEGAAYRSLIDNGLVGAFANAFVVIASESDLVLEQEEQALAYTYSAGRRNDLSKEVCLYRRADELRVRRRLLSPGKPPSWMGVDEDERLLPGELLFNSLLSLVNRPGWSEDQIAAWIAPLFTHLQQLCRKQDGQQVLEGQYLDATPFNLIEHQGRYQLFDLEWRVWPEVSLDFVIFRGLYHSLTRIGTVAPPQEGTPLQVVALAAQVLRRLTGRDCDVLSLVKREADLQGRITQQTIPMEAFGGVLPVRQHLKAPAKRLSPPVPVASPTAAASTTPSAQHGARLAVVLHLYYPEYWSDFAEALMELPDSTDIYITTPPEKLEWTRKLAQTDLPRAKVHACENRGRDLGPLVDLLRNEPIDQYDFVLKLHTKRSPHLPPGEGDRWRRTLIRQLVPTSRVPQLLDYLDQHPRVGLLAPAQWLIRLQGTPTYQSNLPKLKLWAARLGFDVEAGDYPFAAGTMFWVRGCVLAELRKLDIEPTDFEPESGQLDGTLAHALERLMPLLAFKCGLEVAPVPGDPGMADESPGAKTLEEWLKARRLTPDQEREVRTRLQTHDGGPRITVLVQAPAGSREVLDTTLLSLEQACRLELRVDVIVMADPSLDTTGLPGNPRVHTTPPSAWIRGWNELAGNSDSQWILIARAGDVFTPNGFTVLVLDLLGEGQCRAVYCDELYRGQDGALGAAFRPDFNLDLLLSFPAAMASHWCFQRDAFLGVGGFDEQAGEAAEFDLLLRLIEQGGLAGLGHVSEPLLITNTPSAADQLEEQAVLLRHLANRGYAQAQIHQDLPRQYRIEYGHAGQPLVSIIIPTRDQLPLLQRCVESLIEKTRYPHYELLIVDNQSETEEAQAWLQGVAAMGDDRVRVLRYDHPFNFSAMNNLAAEQARGEYLVLLNNDTAIIEPGWLDALLNHAQRPEVGAVGAKLLYPDGTVQHAGVVLGLRGPADHPFMGEAMDAHGTMQRLRVDQNYSAVTAACLMIRKSLYQEVGGMDEADFKVSYNDVDLCLKVGAAGYINVWTPHALVMHEGSVSQKQLDPDALTAKRARFVGEQDAFYSKWMPLVAHDPAYNRNLSLSGKGFTFEARTELVWHPLSWRPTPVVLAHMADHWGCGHYRVIQPFDAMRALGAIEGLRTDTALLPSELARLEPDSIILQRQIGEHRLDVMRRMKAFSRAFKVYELDDYLPNLPLKSAYRQGIPKDALKSLRRGLGYVDRFVVSTDALAEAFEGLHPDTRVVKNRLPTAWWSGFTPQRRRGHKPRVGWAGSAGHAGDLALIADVVKALAAEVEWVFFGMCPTEILPFVHEVHAGVPIDKYPAKLASLDLDLALAPLEQNLFNECKSNLRLIEYGVCGYPVVCSDIRCYQEDGLPVTRVKNRFKEWVDAIRMHTHDLDAAARAGDALREQVRAHWMLEGAALDAWRAAWTQP